MEMTGIAARSSGKAELERALIDAHERTWGVLANLTPEQWEVPYHPGINPPRWEFGHVAWFTEWWVLREAYWDARDENVTRRPSMLAGADRLFDSGRIAHTDRWTLDLPPLGELRDYASAVLDGVRARLAGMRRGPAVRNAPRALSPGHAWRGARLHAADARLFAAVSDPHAAVAGRARATSTFRAACSSRARRTMARSCSTTRSGRTT